MYPFTTQGTTVGYICYSMDSSLIRLSCVSEFTGATNKISQLENSHSAGLNDVKALSDKLVADLEEAKQCQAKGNYFITQ